MKAACLALLLAACCPLRAQQPSASAVKDPTLSATEVFRRASPSVFIVEAMGAQGSVVALGSGVALAPNQIVTNKHVIEDAITVRVRRGTKTWPATITYLDPDHDLCRLRAEDLPASSLSVRASSALAVGERVYAVGSPEGLELTFSEGIISALREFGDARVIQTSAPISPGSIGGGLFDAQGRLVGITTFMVKEGQNLNFALPGEWVLELTKRSDSQKTGQSSDSVSFRALVWFEIGYKAVEAGEDDQALKAYKEAIRLKPDLAGAWNNLGVAYGHLQQYDQALKAYQEATRLKPDFAEAWNNLGNTYLHLQQYDQALMAHQEAIRLKPDYANAWDNLGVNYRKLRQYDQALKAYQEAIRLKPDDANAWYNLGNTYYDLQQYDQALKTYQEAIRLKPDDAEAWYNLGLTYLRQDNRTKVSEVYQRLKALDPAKADTFSGERFYLKHHRTRTLSVPQASKNAQ